MDTLLVGLVVGGLISALTAVLMRRAGEARSSAPMDLDGLRAELRLVAEGLRDDRAQVDRRLEGIDRRVGDSQRTSTEIARDIFSVLGEVRAATATMAEQAREFTSLQ